MIHLYQQGRKNTICVFCGREQQCIACVRRHKNLLWVETEWGTRRTFLGNGSLVLYLQWVNGKVNTQKPIHILFIATFSLSEINARYISMTSVIVNIKPSILKTYRNRTFGNIPNTRQTALTGANCKTYLALRLYITWSQRTRQTHEALSCTPLRSVGTGTYYCSCL